MNRADNNESRNDTDLDQQLIGSGTARRFRVGNGHHADTKTRTEQAATDGKFLFHGLRFFLSVSKTENDVGDFLCLTFQISHGRLRPLAVATG